MSEAQTAIPCARNGVEAILASLDDNVRMLRLTEVTQKVGLSRTSIYDMMRGNAFPKPYRIGASAVAWLSSDIKLWMAEKIAGGRQTTIY